MKYIKQFESFDNRSNIPSKYGRMEVSPGDNKVGDLYMEINDLIDEKYKDLNYEDITKVLENILKGVKSSMNRKS